jgi:hypothetical protein
MKDGRMSRLGRCDKFSDGWCTLPRSFLHRSAKKRELTGHPTAAYAAGLSNTILSKNTILTNLKSSCWMRLLDVVDEQIDLDARSNFLAIY